MTHHIHLTSTDSTNTELRRLAAQGKADNLTMITADYQTAGRGQVGNHWESEDGKNLLMSILMRPAALDVRQQYYLSMAVSCAISKALKSFVNGVQIKWPNDVYVGDRKLAGILIENTLRGTAIADSIVGIGLNINQTVFRSDAPNPVSIAQLTGKNYSPTDIAKAIQTEMGIALQRVDALDYDAIRAEYMLTLYRADGQMYPFTDDNGPFCARIDTVEPDGHIHLVDTDGHTRVYTFKEMEFVID